MGLADEVWVVCRDNRILKPTEWVRWRTTYLQQAINPQKLVLLMKCYREALERLNYWLELREKFRLTALDWINVVAQTAMPNAPKIDHKKFSWRFDSTINYYTKMLRYLRLEIIAETVEAANRIAQLHFPYTISLDAEGTLTLKIDDDLSQWLGEDDYPYKNNDKEAYKTIRRELAIIAQHIHQQTKANTTKENETPAIIKLYQLIKNGQTNIISNKKFLNEILNEINTQPPLLT